MTVNPVRSSTEIGDEEENCRWVDDPLMPAARRFPRDAWPPVGRPRRTRRHTPIPLPVTGSGGQDDEDALESTVPDTWYEQSEWCGESELTDLTDLEVTAHLFQKWIPKAYEVRLTVVGKRHFAVAIHAHSASTRVDWRTDYDALTYEVIDCPTEVAERAHLFLTAAGLTYGAFDFIVTADTEDYIFLECNAAGQWGWLAEECGLPIAEAIADELTGGDR